MNKKQGNTNRAAQPPGNTGHVVNYNTTYSGFVMPEHVDHTTCQHDFIALDDGAVACTICYWIWETEEPLE